jgi:hypothetical protein
MDKHRDVLLVERVVPVEMDAITAVLLVVED